jgi:CheY-like chemotaxis protein/c-di-GMP-binding flagellar brake protein YcgR
MNELMKTSPAKQTILLVDDERNLVRVLEARLRRAGYNTLSAYDGAEALTVLRRYPVKVVVLDVQMSGLGGGETLKAIHALRPTLPVVLMSAYGKPEGLSDVITYLEKPFNLDMLVSAVANALLTPRRAESQNSTFALFSPGQPVRVVAPDGDGLVYGAGWVQAETEESLTVDAPLKDGRVVLPRPQSVVRVTVTGGDGVYSFTSRVQHAEEGLLTLAKPDVIERRQRRRAPRVVASLPVRLEMMPPSGRGRPSVVAGAWESVNLSDTGMMLNGEASVPADSTVHFCVVLPADGKTVSGNARVVWDSLASNQRVAMGLEFTALAGEDRSALTQYLTSFGVGATV